MDAANTLGYRPYLTYNISLCYYCVKQYGPALKHIAEIIERGVREHPELSVGSNTDGIEVRSVGNTQILHETALIEAFNLKAAIEYTLKVPPCSRPCECCALLQTNPSLSGRRTWRQHKRLSVTCLPAARTNWTPSRCTTKAS